MDDYSTFVTARVLGLSLAEIDSMPAEKVEKWMAFHRMLANNRWNKPVKKAKDLNGE